MKKTYSFEFEAFLKKLLMNICSPINSKTSAELSYTEQRVRLIPKATCSRKNIHYKERQSAEHSKSSQYELFATSTELINYQIQTTPR